MKFPHALFKRAGLNSTDVANLFGVSRVTGFRWLSGVDRSGNSGAGVNVFLEEKVRRTAKAVEVAIHSGDLPFASLQKLPPAKRAAAIKRIIRAASRV